MADTLPASSRYWLNRVLFDLGDADNRAAFMTDRSAYLARYPVGEAERTALLGPHWRGLLAQGALPNLVFRYYMLHGLAPDRFAETVKEDRRG